MDIKSTSSAIWNVRPKHPNAPMAKKTCRTKGSMKSVQVQKTISKNTFGSKIKQLPKNVDHNSI